MLSAAKFILNICYETAPLVRYGFHVGAALSVEQSSRTIISRYLCVCSKSLFTAYVNVDKRLYVGITIPALIEFTILAAILEI